MLSAALLLIGMGTYYHPEEFSDPVVLYCGMPAPTHQAWVALNVDLYTSGAVECGSTVLVEFADGNSLMALALDAGPFTGYYIADHPELPIVVDIPYPLWKSEGTSAIVQVSLLGKHPYEERNEGYGPRSIVNNSNIRSAGFLEKLPERW